MRAIEHSATKIQTEFLLWFFLIYQPLKVIYNMSQHRNSQIHTHRLPWKVPTAQIEELSGAIKGFVLAQGHFNMHTAGAGTEPSIF